MLGFHDTFELKLSISESAFLDNLMPFIDVDYHPVSNPFLSPGKLYFGHIKFNHFQLSVPKSVTIINGTFESNPQSLTVKGEVTQSKTAFLLNLLFVLCFLGQFIYSLVFNSGNNGTLIISAIFSIIGIFNYCIAIVRLSKIKADFIQLINRPSLSPTTNNQQLSNITYFPFQFDISSRA